MIKPFVRDSSYFQIVRNSGQLLTGYVFDNQLENIVNFIRNKIIPTLNNLAQNKIRGQLDSDGYLLRNIGDGSTEFSRIRGSDIPNGIITLDRLKRILPNSILYCHKQNLNYINCDLINKTLINDEGNSAFGYIKTINIEPHTIKSEKVALYTITPEHLDSDLLNFDSNIKVDTVKILNESLTGYNISDKSYTSGKLSSELISIRDNENLQFIRGDVTGIAADAHIIKNNHIADNSIDFNHIFNNQPVLKNANIGYVNITANHDISPYSFFNHDNLLSVAYIQDNSFKPNISSAAYGISKNKLSPAIIERLRTGGLVV